MTAHYTEDALLTSSADGLFQIEFMGVKYKPTESADGVGMLLFGLRPRGIQFHVTRDPTTFMAQVERFALAMHHQANRHLMPTARGTMPAKMLRNLVASAVALAPDEVSEVETRRLILENLGPFAFDYQGRLARTSAMLNPPPVKPDTRPTRRPDIEPILRDKDK